MLLAFYKPFCVLSQFTADGSANGNLSAFKFPKNVYPIGRLDADSEGLLLLSDEATLTAKLLTPEHGHQRSYLVQVERIPDDAALKKLAKGVTIQGYKTRPCQVSLLASEPELPPRNPPIRFRKNVPTSWLALDLVEGKNRQVRRMTASIGHPTLRLVRWKIGDFTIGGLQPGEWRELTSAERLMLFKI
ncbi:MAG: pseudouridine synthase [Verrucomicrobiales bacterium]|jgi:23S rRNA pseudouridine2457 synthase|nr:pseudouridine synthase [Verrucomicrobiales bacterium]